MPDLSDYLREPDGLRTMADALDARAPDFYEVAHVLRLLADEGVPAVASRARLIEAWEERDPDRCAICREVYCSGTHCIEGLDADREDHAERVEEVQELALLGRVLRGWLAEEGVCGPGGQDGICEVCGSKDPDEIPVKWLTAHHRAGGTGGCPNVEFHRYPWMFT